MPRPRTVGPTRTNYVSPEYVTADEGERVLRPTARTTVVKREKPPTAEHRVSSLRYTATMEKTSQNPSAGPSERDMFPDSRPDLWEMRSEGHVTEVVAEVVERATGAAGGVGEVVVVGVGKYVISWLFVVVIALVVFLLPFAIWVGIVFLIVVLVVGIVDITRRALLHKTSIDERVGSERTPPRPSQRKRNRK
jgi:hypothetical protein